MRIIQFTDIHVSEKGQKPKGNVDTRGNLKRVLKAISKEQYDLLVMTGDTCLDLPKKSIYKWVVKQCKKRIEFSKFRIIAGNHDDTLMMSATFGIRNHLHGDEYYYRQKIDDRHFIFLDTAKGETSQEQKDWLTDQLKSVNAEVVYIFLHHPPIVAGVPYMDKNHALKDMVDFQKIFHDYPETTFQIFCGHYHVDESVTLNNMNVFVTPSCFFQIDSSKEDFTIDHHRIGYRIIEIDDSGKMITFVKYL